MNVTEDPGLTGFTEAEMDTLTGRLGVMVRFTALDTAGFPTTQNAFEVRVQETASLFEGVYEYVAVVAPGTLLPFTFHKYVGADPPLTGIAVKVTDVPAQTGLADAAMVIPADTSELTVMEMVFEVAGFPLTQTAFDVNTQVTASPLMGA